MINSSDISVSAFGLTDIGRRRKVNEDAFLVADLTDGSTNAEMMTLGQRGALLAVADGMGGSAAGEVASCVAVATIRDELMKTVSDQASSIELKQSAERANDCIWNQARRNPALRGMGTTVTAALVRDGVAYISQVGDSRAYLIRNGCIRQITRDQSLVQNLVDSGLLTAEEAAKHPYRNVILQALGVNERVEVALTAVELCRDDYLLICSDGLSNKVKSEEMLRAVESESPAYACRLLTELANMRGGEDNITVIIARFEGEALGTCSGELNTGRLNVMARAA